MIISGFRSMVFLFTQAMVFPLTETMGKVLAFYTWEKCYSQISGKLSKL
jgi:uncharacterized membrane protein